MESISPFAARDNGGVEEAVINVDKACNNVHATYCVVLAKLFFEIKFRTFVSIACFPNWQKSAKEGRIV